MREAKSPFAGSILVTGLFAIGLGTIPFDAVLGFGAVGELGYELSFPFFALAIATAIFLLISGRPFALGSSLTLRIAAAVLVVIALSYAANFSEINDALFRERSGLNKFTTSLLVVLYGLALAWLAEQLEPRNYGPVLARFVCWSAAIATVYLAFEFAGKQGWLGGAFDQVDRLIHTRQADVINPWDGRVNEKVAFGWDPRLRSVSFEPPAFGNYAGFAWPWVWYAAMTARPNRQLRAIGLFAAFNIAMLVAANRTALLMICANAQALLFLWALSRPTKGNGEAAAAVRLVLPIVVLVGGAFVAVWAFSRFDTIVNGVVLGDSVSNISRLGLQVAGTAMFVDHPLLGTGLGQFGFHVSQYLPDWIFHSPEIAPMVTYPDAPWPNVYSLYVRLGAELGLVGLAGWLALWLGLGGVLALRSPATGEDRPAMLARHAVILNCVGVLVAGVASDTFRTPMIWIALGVGCRLIAERRRINAASRAPAPRPASLPLHSPQ